MVTWEQRKLGTAIKIIKDKNKNQHSYRAFSISNIKGFIAQDEQFGKDNTYSKTDKSTNYIVKSGMFAYNPARINVGSIAYQNQTEPVLVSSLYEIFQTNSKIDDSFLMNWFKTSLFNRQIKRLEEGGVRQYFFIDKMKETEIKLPSISEQNQISKLLQLVNKNLDLQQRKLDILIKLNRNIIINLFKEIRVNHHAIELKHTASNWKSARLKELGICQSGFGFPIKEQNGSKGIPFFKVSDFNTFGNEIYLQYANNYVTNHQIRKNKWKIFDQVPAIVFAKVGAAIFLNRKRMINEPFLIDNNLMAFELNLQKLDYKFAKILFDNMYLPKFAQVGALPSYNASDINAIKVKIPDMDSQKKIANIIMKNNNEIILQKQILQKGKELKQFLLQNMFI
ncbi:restriction endonuclease subunit S [Lactobacillus amylovorus]|uniref:restriction endonuclease subunit S n=1 Tax=Lactobacillus amylovorus TaxID=1604 RepID=UPI00232D8220|nr:restriction endonuclease subunit S [Lactobacillus amylovorus]MDB6221314.1 restriction endonuclease subunit S [Lactobacillus amylovorus]